MDRSGQILQRGADRFEQGNLVMIAPAGMEIRDGMFGLLLEGLLPIGAAMALAVGVRLWLTLTELIWTFGGRWIFGRARDS